MHIRTSSELVRIFSQVDDPRSDINKLHKLEDILLIGIISVICGVQTWKQMVGFAKSKEDFLRDFLELSNGIPSKDTFSRTFASIDSSVFENCFIEWVNSLSELKKGQVISIDGKTLRGVKCNGTKSPIHMASAWANENNLVLGQVRVNEKSNEITAMPQLLELLAEKGNQKQLYQDIQEEFFFAKETIVDTSIDIGHGRIKTRVCTVLSECQFIDNRSWEGLKSVIRIESIREFKGRDKEIEKSVRYYISNRNDTAKDFQKHIRSHWSVENQLH